MTGGLSSRSKVPPNEPGKLAAKSSTARKRMFFRLTRMSKRLATDSGSKIVNDALQLFGGYGYLRDYPIERFWRGLRVHSILEGTNQVMRMIVGRTCCGNSEFFECPPTAGVRRGSPEPPDKEKLRLNI